MVNKDLSVIIPNGFIEHTNIAEIPFETFPSLLGGVTMLLKHLLHCWVV